MFDGLDHFKSSLSVFPLLEKGLKGGGTVDHMLPAIKEITKDKTAEKDMNINGHIIF